MGSMPPPRDPRLSKTRIGTLVDVGMSYPRKSVQGTLFVLDWIQAASAGHMGDVNTREAFYRRHEAVKLRSIHAFAFADGSVARLGGGTLVVCANLKQFLEHPLGGGIPSWRDVLRYRLRSVFGLMFFEFDPDELEQQIRIGMESCQWKLPVEFVVDPD